MRIIPADRSRSSQKPLADSDLARKITYIPHIR